MDRSAMQLGPGAYFRTLFVFFLLLTATLAGAGLAWLAGSTWQPLHQTGAAWWLVVAGGFLTASALLLLALPTIVRFIRCGWQHAIELLHSIGPALLLFLLTASAASLASQGTVRKQEETLGVMFGSAPQREPHDAVFIPFFPIEGKSKSCDPKQTEFDKAELMAGPGVERAFKDLVASLARCTNSTNQVTVDIRGFASSSEFRGCPGKLPGSDVTVSEHLNWRLAESRRQTVVSAVRGVSRNIRIDPSGQNDRWSGPGEMRRNMQFYDRDDKGDYDHLKAALTRRAEIVIVSKGSCEPRSI